MTIYDFFYEKIVPLFKSDYQDFNSKSVEGYEVFKAKWSKTEHEAMVTAAVLELLQHILEKLVKLTNYKKYQEENLHKSQVARWYVNGFTMEYNECRRYDLKHPYKQADFMESAQRLKPSEDLELGGWNVNKFRKYTVNLGRHEGTLFYMTEHTGAHDDSASSRLAGRELPQELQTNESRQILEKAIAKGLCDAEFHWLKSKLLLSYFADCASGKLHLSKAEQDGKEKVCWKPFETLFGYTDLASGKNTYTNKTGKLPNEYELVDSIFK